MIPPTPLKRSCLRLLNHALDALPRLAEHGLSEPASIQKAWAEFRGMTDPLAVWLDRYTIDDPDAVVTQNTLRAAYGAECERRGRPGKNATAFGRDLRRHRPAVEKSRRTVSGKQTWCYVGIGLIHKTGRVDEVAEVATVYPTLFSRTREEGYQEGGETLGGSHKEKQRGKNRGNLGNLVYGDTTQQQGDGELSEDIACPKCDSLQFKDTTLPDGRIRRDCASCGHTLDFPVWTAAESSTT